jgi:phosphatidylinositol glycan class T
MAVSVEVTPQRLHLVQTLTLVLRLDSPPPAYHGTPRPATLPSWSLGKAFNAQLSGSCPLASTSRIYVQLPAGSPAGPEVLQPRPAATLQATGSQAAAVHSYEVRALAAAGGGADIRMQQLELTGDSSSSSSSSQPLFSVHSYTTGSGNLHGGMVLELVRTAQHGPAAAAGSAAGSSSSSTVGQATLPICIFQVVPWYVRMWLHTLQLRLDGQPADLAALTIARRLVPAQDRRQQLQLELCLALPAGTQQVLLTAEFSKAFLTVFECPPDTNRGHDVPAALVTYPDASVAGWQGVSCDLGSQHASGDDTAGDAGALAAQQQQGCEELKASPLLQQLGAGRVQQQYSQGLLVPLAAPDFSMPYNVCCLTSTVLAIYVGAVLNTLMKRHQGSGSGADAKSEARKKAVKFVVVLVVFGGLAVYLDDGLREQVEGLMKQAGVELA